MLRRGENWHEGSQLDVADLKRDQERRLVTGADSVRVVMAGEIIDLSTDSPLVAMLVCDTDSMAAVSDAVQAYPLVSDGTLTANVIKWYGPTGLSF